MLAIYYLFICFAIGYILIDKYAPWIYDNWMQLPRRPYSWLSQWVVKLPSSFLIGTLFTTWCTYLLSYIFKKTPEPMLYGNIITMTCLTAVIFFLRPKFNNSHISLDKFLDRHWTEIILCSAVLFIWYILFYRSLHMDGSVINVGYSVYSDFGPHLSLIRSFSYGTNFPAQYPHFPDGTIRYHFMFMFLAGNLEYLGLNIADAFNFPSLLSMLSLCLLLYALSAMLTGRKAVGIIAILLFFFRSSFAFFTFTSGFSNLGEWWNAIISNLTSQGNSREHIGKTLHEDWGLWAQKVFVNQRHLIFAAGILLLILFIFIPPVLKSVYALQTGRLKNNKEKLGLFISNNLLSPIGWLPENSFRAISAGIILGLSSFWNGAAVIAALLILFILAIFSYHRLEFLITALITVFLSLIQSRFFMGNSSAVHPAWSPGFLANSGSIKDVLSYVFELQGIFPVMLLLFISLMLPKSRPGRFVSGLLGILSILLIIIFMPRILLIWKALIVIIIALCFIFTVCRSASSSNRKKSGALLTWDGAPVILLSFLILHAFSFTISLTSDITVNHKYIIIGTMLLNIPIAWIIHLLFSNRGFLKKFTALALTLILTITGIVDFITLLNIDRNRVEYDNNDPLLQWARLNTPPDSIFLTYMHVSGPILLAGRSIFYGWPYFTATAGYDESSRYETVRKIYSAGEPETVKSIATANNIRYIVIEPDNRNCPDYTIDEEMFDLNFPLVYEDSSGNIKVYQIPREDKIEK